ncbi:integrase [Oleiphilus sp. HI0079]|uniref:site-specific integrase n=1 Tax=Oleiphilus sp. HI0079 TaxID=1822254 RepID=UPI0007C36BF4|nr:site-specific integrase [Oleiphilus sp. HI0079]KZZ13463.1 integrase [Oleiphilus sp. HI0079]
MAANVHVRVRPETSNLYLDFSYQGVRCREQTALKDTPSNRKVVTDLAKKVEARMVLGEFDYASFFPDSKNLAKLPQSQSVVPQVGLPGNASLVADAPMQTVLFADYVESWFAFKQVEWRRSHSDNMRCLVDSSLKPFFGHFDLAAITKNDILVFRSELCSRPGRKGELLGAKTVNNHMQLLHSILLDASDEFGFVNPFRNIKTLKSKKQHIAPFSLDEINLIIDNVREDYKNYYRVRFFSGLRTGEIDGLQWRYVDFESKQILVRETIVKGKMEYTKTEGSQREVPMLGPVYEALKEQYEATGQLSDFVFCNAEGKPLDHVNVTKRVWYPLLRALGLEKRRPYMTRHSTATLLLASGESPEFIARFLGHTSTEMLFTTYSRYVPNLTRADGSAFEKLVAQKEVNDEA